MPPAQCHADHAAVAVAGILVVWWFGSCLRCCPSMWVGMYPVVPITAGQDRPA
jgi:hypothetical protein